MQIEFKLPKAHICQDNMCFKTTFVLVKNLTDKVILGNPFLCSLYPFTVDSKGITTQPFGQTIKFRFISEPVPRNISTIQLEGVSKTMKLISAKTAHLKYLQEEIRYKKVEDQLEPLQDALRYFDSRCSSSKHRSQFPIIMIFSQRYKIHWISRWDYSINSNLLDREFSVKWWDSLKINKIISQMYEDYPLPVEKPIALRTRSQSSLDSV